ncbi:MAG: hypothetical protein E7463_02955 [Ruminococcaceae bacterium]|nr:hypothetical protein [Oscillospiraceae bacterium]
MEQNRLEALSKFYDLPVIDAHIHHSQPYSLKESLGFFREIMEKRNYAGMAFMAYTQDAADKFYPQCNLEALYYKKHLPGTWAFASLSHNDTAEGYLAQAKTFMAQGFDGMKMLEGKPDLYRALGRSMDDPIYDRYYEYLEENQVPIVLHVADPASFWDPDKVSESAKARGWFYGHPSFPARERLYIEIWNIMRKFPKLRLTLAHFGFMGFVPQLAEEFLAAWENTGLDLTPGGEMFVGFSKNPAWWHDFFVRYQDRIVFGTDGYNMPENPEAKGGPTGRWELVRSCLEFTEPFDWPYFGRLVPLGLDRDVMRKIYYDNNLAFLGSTPKAIDEERIDWAQFPG